MTSLETTLRHIGREFSDLEVPFALVGGLAVSIRTEPRFTRDADLAVAVSSDTEAEALVTQLQNYRIEAVLEHEAVGRLSTVRLTRAGESGAPAVDLLFASSGIGPRGSSVASARRIPVDLERAERAVKLIAARGYGRGRALLAELNELLYPSAPSS